MRFLCLALTLLVLSGCVLGMNLPGDRTIITVINNTAGADLEILVGNQVICKELEPGKHFGVQVGFNRHTNISIIGRDSRNVMIGVVSAVFYGGEYREYNYNYSGYSGGSGSLSRTWVINTRDLRRRD